LAFAADIFFHPTNATKMGYCSQAIS